MSTPDRNRDRESDRQAVDDDARINELVNERVTARLAEITRQQDEQQQRTDHVRSANDHETRHQQHAGRPSAGPSADDIARTLADALTSRHQISLAETVFLEEYLQQEDQQRQCQRQRVVMVVLYCSKSRGVLPGPCRRTTEI
ncbi:unnamed protein product [Ectocarpus sp. CCAP 1310/34]|nr:unnamed protein product [Ectocarpus sp. CCAP 1310/34]